MPKDGIFALDGIIETDWADAAFTMNWKFTRPHHPVSFAIGEPIAMIVPQPRGELECFDPVIRPIGADPKLEAAFRAWQESRRDFNKALQQPGSMAQQAKWQKHYVRGESVVGDEGGQSARRVAHQSKLALAAFREDMPAPAAKKD